MSQASHPVARRTHGVPDREFWPHRPRGQRREGRESREGDVHMDDGRDRTREHVRSVGEHHSSPAGIQPRVWVVVTLLLAALMVLAGCGTAGTTSSDTSTATATSKPCQRIATLDQTLTQLSTMGDNTTVGEVKAIQQKLTTALDAVDKLPGTDGSALSNLQAANDQLAEAIKDLPDSATVGQVGPRFQEFRGKVSQAQAAVAKLASTLHC